jgi:hypothetical protein
MVRQIGFVVVGCIGLVAPLAIAACSGSSSSPSSTDGGTGTDGTLGADTGGGGHDSGGGTDTGGNDGGGGNDTGGGNDGGGTDGPSTVDVVEPTPTAECTAYAQARCTLDGTCQIEFLQADFGGSQPACVTGLATVCTIYEQAQGTGWSQANIQGCTTAITGSKSCLGGFADAGSPCVFVGAGAGGAACGTGYQCASRGCTIKPGNACGTCDTVATAAQACGGTTGANCDVDLNCHSGKCATYVAKGGACDDAHVCLAGYSCVGDAGAPADAAVSGTCQLNGTAVGTPCTVGGSAGLPGCQPEQGFYCDGTGKCANITNANPGSPCGLADGGTSDVACTSGECVAGNCVAYLAPGAPCTTNKKPNCSYGLQCVATTDGGTAGNCLPINSANCH